MSSRPDALPVLSFRSAVSSSFSVNSTSNVRLLAWACTPVLSLALGLSGPRLDPEGLC
ncbi:hypothetical protein PoB_001232100 [Plakobranchus ocellatus]|uniref:Uncharacterized protein n=1 Tax=Plakobranchus ocellatus TaxID=259542 RepID=A0AAV3YR66_9GAST|nr:hypothetical protein PoB_001232100 [Plakobranchus ocellatus]